MRKITLCALTLGTALAGAAIMIGPSLQAQEAPRPMERPQMEHGPGDDQRGMHMPGRGEMMGGGGMMGRRMHDMMRSFALIYPAPDRALSGPDVQRIAEGFLLFNGNHTWKVTEVAEEPDRVTFALATSDGIAIAHFAMNRHTGRPERLS